MPSSVRSDAAALEALRLPSGVAEALPRALDGSAGSAELGPGWRLVSGSWGERALFGPAGGDAALRWGTWERHGRPVALLRWTTPPGEPARLERAWLTLPGGGWLAVQPGAAQHPLWGPCDALAVVAGPAEPMPAPLTLMAAVDYRAPATIPPVERPAALLRGAGEVLLNLLALLAADAGREALHYRGPYPTPRLFEALQRSFAPAGPVAEAAERFAADQVRLAFRGALAENPVPWAPRPHAVRCPAPDVRLHGREEPEALWLGARAFRRAARVGGRLPAGPRLWTEPAGGHRAGLVLLGEPFREALALDAAAEVLERAPSPPEPEAAGAPLHPAWLRPALAWCALGSATPLAGAVLALVPRLRLAWAPLAWTLAAPLGDAMCVQAGLTEQFRRLAPGAEPGGLALMLVSDVLEGLAPLLRRRAQADLEGAAHQPTPGTLLREGTAAQARAREVLERTLPSLVQRVAAGEALP